jgi:hypothetical protein
MEVFTLIVGLAISIATGYWKFRGARADAKALEAKNATLEDQAKAQQDQIAAAKAMLGGIAGFIQLIPDGSVKSTFQQGVAYLSDHLDTEFALVSPLVDQIQAYMRKNNMDGAGVSVQALGAIADASADMQAHRIPPKPTAAPPATLNAMLATLKILGIVCLLAIGTAGCKTRYIGETHQPWANGMGMDVYGTLPEGTRYNDLYTSCVVRGTDHPTTTVLIAFPVGGGK